MRVIIAGYNTDRENPASTPETISAAYARISRTLRLSTSFEGIQPWRSRSQESNRRIVFDYGHGSVAEHACFQH